MDGRDVPEASLRDLAERFRTGLLSRRELLERAGLLVGGATLASFLATCGSLAPAALAASAPGSQPKKGGILKVAFWSEPGVLDPVFTTRYQTLDVACNFFECLFADSAKYSPKPMLAASYELSRDGKLVTIGLRKGVRRQRTGTIELMDLAQRNLMNGNIFMFIAAAIIHFG